MNGRKNLALACGRAAAVALLCGLLIDEPVLAEAPAGAKKLATAAVAKDGQAQIQGQQRVLHALNRLTFGPRPGEVAAVEKMGLNKWFEQQLNPQSIDDAKLDAMLAEYPAMQMSIAQLEQKYPGPFMIRALASGKADLPSDPTERAMVQDQLAFYKLQKARQEGKKDAAPGTMQAGAGTEMNEAAGAGGAEASQMQDMQGKATPANEMAPDPLARPDAAEAASSHAELSRLLALPADDRMHAILAMSPAQLVRLTQGLGPQQKLQLVDGMSAQQKETLTALPGSLRMVALEAMESRMMRDIYSDRQLEAVMTDFWLNHFNVYVRKNQIEPYLIPSYERETIRPHALGKFEDLLVATAKSPAMLVYLDNFRSVGPDSEQVARLQRAQMRFPNANKLKQASAGLNENYGRELMELHTLGVNGGYTQADVTQVAKVFTGWTVDKPYQGGDFTFDERRHEPGSKTVLGKTIHENGQKEGLEVLHMLATSPATAHFISQKLAVRFVSDDPPAALVDRMAQSFLKSDGDIKTVLRTMFESPEFWSPAVYRAKVKTPEEFVISAVRASGAVVAHPQALVQSLDKLGMPFYGMQTPNGYHWTQEDWVSTGALVSRLNFALVLSDNRIPGVTARWSALLGENAGGVVPASYTSASTGNSAAAKEMRLEKVLLEQPVSEKTRATVLGQSDDASVAAQAETQFDLRATGGKQVVPRQGRYRGANAPVDDQQAAVMAGLLLGSPEFQRR